MEHMTDISLKGKVAIIAGASRGMGREIAITYAKAGAAGITVVAAPAVDETRESIQAELDEVVSSITAAGGKGLGLMADVTSFADCTRVVSETIAKYGGLHVLFHNAGKSQRYHGKRDIPFWETDHDGWRDVIVTNVVGPYLMAKATIPHFLKQKWGRIIVTSKSADSMHERFAGAYGPSKAAVEAHVLSWAEETAGTGVNCNCVNPGGAVNTKFGRGAASGRGLEVSVMNNIALWLASDLSADYNGCRFSAKFWEGPPSATDSGERCRETPLFPVPHKTSLGRAWTASPRATLSIQSKG